MSVSSDHKGKRGCDFSQYIFLSMKGKKVKQSSSFATDGEQDQLEKSLWGLKGKTAEMPLLRVSQLPPAWDVFVF